MLSDMVEQYTNVRWVTYLGLLRMAFHTLQSSGEQLCTAVTVFCYRDLRRHSRWKLLPPMRLVVCASLRHYLTRLPHICDQCLQYSMSLLDSAQVPGAHQGWSRQAGSAGGSLVVCTVWFFRWLVDSFVVCLYGLVLWLVDSFVARSLVGSLVVCLLFVCWLFVGCLFVCCLFVVCLLVVRWLFFGCSLVACWLFVRLLRKERRIMHVMTRY